MSEFVMPTPCPLADFNRSDRLTRRIDAYEERAAEIATELATACIKSGMDSMCYGEFNAAAKVYPGGAAALEHAVNQHEAFGGSIPKSLLTAFEFALLPEARVQLDGEIDDERFDLEDAAIFASHDNTARPDAYGEADVMGENA